MTTLRVVLDDLLRKSPRGIARYGQALTLALITNAPRGCLVEGVVSAMSDEDYAALQKLVPGLADVMRLPLGNRELRTLWQHGLTSRPLGGMVHSPSLLAPLTRHSRTVSPGDQTVVTIHDATPWLFPEDDDPNSAWIRHMTKRARKHADAVVVPTHATADALREHVDFGERVRVISGAVSSQLTLPEDPDAVAARLDLPDAYIVTVGTLAPHKGLEALMRAASLPQFPTMPLLIIGPQRWGDRDMDQAIFQSGAPSGRIRHINPLPDSELAVVLERATLAVVPSMHEGFGLTAVEALHFATPLVHSDTPALLEVVAGAGAVVPTGPNDTYPERLADVIGQTASDSDTLRRLSIEGQDRARAFSWRDSAERVWQLHADL